MPISTAWDHLPVDDAARRQAIGSMLRGCRIRSGLSQRDLAYAVACEPTYISHIERGEREPSLGMLVRLGEAVGLRVRLEDDVLAQIPAREAGIGGEDG